MVATVPTVLPTVEATRYVTPLREGGSLPGLVEADDDGTYVVKFRGAGQGPAALAAEIVTGELARRLGLRVPDLVLVELDPEIGRREPDEEVQDLLTASAGLNLGVDFLPGSLGYDGMAWRPAAEEAARVLWLDGFVGNVDRSWRNPNLLVWHRRMWLIDHGATLLFQHGWPERSAWAARVYDHSEHALAGFAAGLPAADAELGALVDGSMLGEVLELVPDSWLAQPSGGGPPRPAYRDYLLARLAARAWLAEAAA